jgi:RimJ/RimL family protein N-acetyltransferase
VDPTDGVVVLGSYELADAPVLVEADRDSEHRRRFDFPDDFVPSLAKSEAVIVRWQRQREAGERFAYAVRHVATGELVGGVELKPEGDGVANLSYWTYPAHRRCGFATRAAALACQIGFAEFGYRSLRIVADPDNSASRRIAERCGFRESGLEGSRVLYLRERP